MGKKDKKQKCEPIKPVKNKDLPKLSINKNYSCPNIMPKAIAQGYYVSPKQAAVNNSFPELLYVPKHFTDYKIDKGTAGCIKHCMAEHGRCSAKNHNKGFYPKCHEECVRKCFKTHLEPRKKEDNSRCGCGF